MAKSKVKTEQHKAILEALGKALEVDPKAITTLLNTRVECNKKLEKRLGAFVASDGYPLGFRNLSVIGLINSVLAAAGIKPVAMMHDTGLGSFPEQIVGFQTYVADTYKDG